MPRNPRRQQEYCFLRDQANKYFKNISYEYIFLSSFEGIKPIEMSTRKYVGSSYVPVAPISTTSPSIDTFVNLMATTGTAKLQLHLCVRDEL